MTEQQDDSPPTELDRLDPAPSPGDPPEPLPSRPPQGPPGAAEAAVLRDLARLPEDLQKSVIAVTAVILARSLDEGAMLPRDATGVVREIRMSMTQLRLWNPAGESGDETDATREQMDNVRRLYVAE